MIPRLRRRREFQKGRSCVTKFSTTTLVLAVVSLVPLRGASLTGTVLDRQNAAIASAEITLLSRAGGARTMAITDAAGGFRFDRIAPGPYLIEATATGFTHSAAKAVQVQPGDNDPVQIELEVAGIRTSVVVTASGTPQTADETSKAITTIDAQNIDMRHDRTVAEALSGVPGLRVNRLGGPGAFTSVRVRGLRDEDTALLLDGFRVRDAATTQADATAFWSDLAVTNLDRVEVLRGSGSSLYGTNAVGGVVNVISDDGGGRTRASVLMEGGSLASFRGRAKVAGGFAHDRVQYSAGVSHWNVLRGVDGDDPARDTSTQTRLGFVLTPKARVFGRIFSADAFSKLNADPAVAEGVAARGIINAGPATFIPAADDPDNTRAARLFSGAAGLNWQLTTGFGLNLSYQGLTTYRRFVNGPAGAGYQPLGNTRADYNGSVHTVAARFDLQPGTRQHLSGGYEFEREVYGNRSLQTDATENSAVSVHQLSHSEYVQDQFSLLGGRLQLAASVRAQQFALGTPMFTPQNSAPYKGLSFAAPPRAFTTDGSASWYVASTGTKIRAHVGSGYRAPSLYERFGTYFSSYGYSVYGDPRLGPDRSIAFDAGVDQMLSNGRVRICATYFYTWLRQVIVFDASGAINPALDPFGRWGGYINTRGRLARGFEGTSSFSPTRTLDVTASYTYTNARERRSLVEDVLQTYIVPAHHFAVFAAQRIGPRFTLTFDLNAFTNYLAPLFDPVTYSSRAYRFPGMKNGQLGGAYRLPLRESKAVRFFGKADNIFNQKYFESGFPTPRLTGMGGMQFEF
jgi:iron complex outermembrane receptor protein